MRHEAALDTTPFRSGHRAEAWLHVPARAGVLPFLIALAALGAASMNVLLPSLPLLQEAFGVDYRTVQQILTLYLVGAALAQLTVGSLSDVRGRRSVLILSLGVLSLGSTVCALAPSIELLFVGRFLQGFGAAGCLVMAEAIVVDLSAPATLPLRIGLLNWGMALAIMLAPLAGAGLSAVLGWRSVLVADLAAGGILLAIYLRHGAGSGAAEISGVPQKGRLRTLGALLRSRQFVSQSFCAGFVMVNYFSLAAFGSYVAVVRFGLSLVEFGLVFGIVGAGYVAGSLASASLYARAGCDRAVTSVLAAGSAAGLAGYGLDHSGGISLPAFVAVGVGISVTAGLVLPAITARALTAEPGTAGAASGLFNFVIFAVGGLATHLIGALLDPSGSIVLLALPVATVAALLLSLGKWPDHGER